MLPVCSAEKTSVEKAASRQSHAMVGIHEIKTLRRTGGAEASRLKTDKIVTYSIL